MSVQVDAPNTINRVAEITGIPANQIQYAIVRGELTPEGAKARHAYTFTDEQVAMLKAAAPLVEVGAQLYVAIRAVRNGLIADAVI